MNTSRREFFLNLKDDAWNGKGIAKLKRCEMDECLRFLEEREALSVGEFESAVARMFMDRPAKPKNWTLMADLLMAANIQYQTSVDPEFYSRFRRR